MSQNFELKKEVKEEEAAEIEKTGEITKKGAKYVRVGYVLARDQQLTQLTPQPQEPRQAEPRRRVSMRELGSLSSNRKYI